MAKSQKDRGRIYQSNPAANTYQGAARSIGFNPVKAENDEKKLRDYKAAIIADGQTISRELTRQQSAENQALEAQQVNERGSLRVGQVGAEALLQQTQLKETADLKGSQLAESNQLKLDEIYLRNKNSLDLGALRANQQIDQANTKVAFSAIQGLIDFGVSVYKTKAEFAEKIEEQKLEDQKSEALESSFFGSNFFSNNTDSAKVLDAQGEVVQEALTAEVQSLAQTANDLRAENNAFSSYQAELIEGMSSWNGLADTRGNVFAARMQYEGFLSEAQALGLIRPGSQGLADIQALNRKFADASGLTSAALVDPKFVNDNFTRQAYEVAVNTLRSVNNASFEELKKTRTAKVDSNIASLWAGVSATSSPEDLGKAWTESHVENVNGNYGGLMSATSKRTTTEKVLKELQDAGRTAEILNLRQYAPNPNTPNLTLGVEFKDQFDAALIVSRDKARQGYTRAQSEQTIRANQAVERYWAGEQTPATLRQVVAELDDIGGNAARTLKTSLVKNGYQFDPNLAGEIASKRGTDEEYSVKQIRDFYTQGRLSKSQYETALRFAPDAQLQSKIKEALDFYKPEKTLINDIKAEGGRTITYNKSNRASAAFKQELFQREKRFKIELGRRLQGVLRDNRDLEVESQAFQDIVSREAEILRQQPRFKINYATGAGYSFGSDGTASDLAEIALEKITVSEGVQNFTIRGGLTAKQVVRAKIPKAMVDPTVDIILTPEQLAADTEKILAGKTPSSRTLEWSGFVGMTPKDLINSQRLMMDMPSVDDLSKVEEVPTATITPGNKTEGMRALMSLGMPLRGAAYMSSAIQHESAWRAQRPSWDLGSLDNAGRNGGLLSWNRGRLANLERRYGRAVEQITEAEQLQFLIQEMKVSYPESYRVLFDQNASSTDLQAATYNYIRWNKKFTGSRWTMAEGLIRWGNDNF